MRHSVQLFVGEAFRSCGDSLKEYLATYGETPVLPYVTVALWDETLTTDSAIKDYFVKLYSSTLTAENPGDNRMLLVNLYVALWDEASWATAQRILTLLAGIQPVFQVDVIGLAADLSDLFGGAREEMDRRVKGTQETVRKVVDYKNAHPERLSHFILLQNFNEHGVSMNFDSASLLRIFGEWALLGAECYSQIFQPQCEGNLRAPLTTFGLSELDFDRQYFVNYLLRRTYLHILQKENISQEKVDISLVSKIAQQRLQPCVERLTLFYQQEVKPLVKEKMAQQEIILTVTPKIDALFGEIEEQLLSYIYDPSLSLPEKKATLARILGLDDELISGYAFEQDQWVIDDLDRDACMAFVEENNKNVTKVTDDHGNDHYVPFVLKEPTDAEEHAYLPIQQLKSVKEQIQESTEYIRHKSTELEQLVAQEENRQFSEKKLVGDHQFVFGGTTYQLLRDVQEQPLEEDYQPKDPKTLLGNVDLSANFLPVKNQGGMGACSAFALVAIYEYILRKSTQANKRLSERFVYYNVRKDNQQTGVDSGASLYDAVKSMTDTGVCLEELFPYSDADLTTAPSDESYVDAGGRKILKAQNVKCAVDDIRSALTEGYPVAVSLKVYDSFGKSGAFITRPDEDETAADESAGFHAMVVVGYSDEDRFFKVRNSWGTDFGDKGYCYIPYSYMSDPELLRMACIITEVSVTGAKVAGIGKRAIMEFDAADVHIRKAIISNLVEEEKVRVKQLSKQYEILRRKYDTLMQSLGNNSIRTKIFEGGVERLDEEIYSLKQHHAQVIESLRPEAVDTFKAETRKVLLYAIPGALLFLLTTASAAYYKWEGADISGNELLFVAVLALLSVFFVLLYIPYRRKGLQNLKEEYEAKAQHINLEIQRKNEERDLKHLRLHIAGMVIDRLLDLQTRLNNRYNAMRSYLGNLKQWQQEQAQLVKEMNAEQRYPFIPLLSNRKLDAYFESRKEQITAHINLYDYFRGYKLDEDYIIQYKQQLTDTVKGLLMEQTADFTVLKYVLGEQHYDYIDDTHADLSTLLPMMNKRSETFLQYHQLKDATDLLQTLFIHQATDDDTKLWNSKYPQYFQLRPMSTDILNKSTLALLSIKQLAVEDVALMKL